MVKFALLALFTALVLAYMYLIDFLARYRRKPGQKPG